MNDILNTFEQFCKKHNKNVLIKEVFHKDGSLELICTYSDGCDNDCRCLKRLKYDKTFNNNQK